MLCLLYRFPNNPWSYEACATPAPGSLLCPALANPILPAVIPSAPIAPIAPIAPSDLLPHPEVVVGPAHGHHDHHVPTIGDVLTGGYDPESIGDIRQGDASSKSKCHYFDTVI